MAGLLGRAQVQHRDGLHGVRAHEHRGAWLGVVLDVVGKVLRAGGAHVANCAAALGHVPFQVVQLEVFRQGGHVRRRRVVVCGVDGARLLQGFDGLFVDHGGPLNKLALLAHQRGLSEREGAVLANVQDGGALFFLASLAVEGWLDELERVLAAHLAGARNL